MTTLPNQSMSVDGLNDMVVELKEALTKIAADPNTTPQHRAQAQEGLAQFNDIESRLSEAVDGQFVQAIEMMQRRCYSNSHAKGFWPAAHTPGAEGGRNDGEAVALLHSEVTELVEPLISALRLNAALSDLLEAVRSGSKVPSKKIEGFTLVEEEAADVLIRLLEWTHGRGLRLAEAALAKHQYNLARPHKHGREF